MGDGPPVLWLGGPPGAGKTSVARLIARRRGLRWYNSDAHTWEHRDRAVADGHPGALRWERMTHEERWAEGTGELLSMSLHHERGQMIADDLRALPARPLTVAEGSPVTPAVMAAPDRALWLLPTPELQHARLIEQGLSPDGGFFRLYRALFDEIEAKVEASGAAKLTVDGSLSVAETVAEVERRFAGPLAEGPAAASANERRELLRYANRAIVSQHLQAFARPWSRGDARTAVRAFACECGAEDCTRDVELAIADFPEPPDSGSPAVLFPGHRQQA
ncbi:hypothetical protein [Streptomyces albidus (ex Kaewkla and Franco 2022)]|uniref:hypothetical protein n=1 Tax=Streptomyces albidus (ex Kaewkla and Franco 2022) TaxID=722709 RepID=UPI0015EE46C8|nr:hypothetical protein [Streptomyces albidus (ex Kaewkla and Franco 2022)]